MLRTLETELERLKTENKALTIKQNELKEETGTEDNKSVSRAPERQ